MSTVITYKLLGGDDPWGGETHTMESARHLVAGEMIYCNARWFHVLRAGLICEALERDSPEYGAERYGVILEMIP